MGGDFLVHNILTVSRIYGIASIAVLVHGMKSNEAFNYWDLLILILVLIFSRSS